MVTRQSTSRGAIAVLVLAGIATALQVGKVPVALPSLGQEMGSSLVTLGWIVAIFSLITAAFGTLFGAIARRLGLFGVGLSGLLICATSNFIGSFAPNAGFLLATRVVEGLGYLMVITSLPPLVMQFAKDDDRRSVLAIWSLFIPAGSFLAMVTSGPVLAYSTWRWLWVLVGVALLVSALSLWILRRRQSAPALAALAPPPPSSTDTRGGGLAGLWDVVRAPTRIVAGLTFGVYAAQYMAITGFIPLLLQERLGWQPVAVGTTVALVVLVNAGSNGLSAAFFRRGWASSSLILMAGSAMIGTPFFIFSPQVPPAVNLAAMVVFAAFSGFVPASLFGSLPILAPRPDMTPTVSGMLMQGSAIGQLLGPPLVAAAVGLLGGWSGAIGVLMFLTVLMLSGAWFLRARGA